MIPDSDRCEIGDIMTRQDKRTRGARMSTGTLPPVPHWGKARTVIEPPGRGPGNWAGAANVLLHDGFVYLTYRMRRPLAQAALMVHWLYGIPLAAPLAALICREKTALPLSLAAVKALQISETDHELQQKRLENVRSLRYRIRLRSHHHVGMQLKRVMMHPADFKHFPLPDRLFWLYAPLRPIFWFWRHYVLRVSER